MDATKKLLIGGLIAGIGFVGYQIGHKPIEKYIRDENRKYSEQFEKSNQPITGTVLEEKYHPSSEKSNSKYTLKILTNDGKTLGVSIIDSENIKKESLDILINKKSKINFPRGNILKNLGFGDGGLEADYWETWFTQETKIGTKRANRITILDE